MSFDPQASGSEPGPSLRAQSGFNGESPSIRRESARRRDARLEPPPIIAQGERRSTSLERIRPQRVFAPGENRRSRKAPAKAGPRRAVRRTNSTSGAFGRWLAYVPNEFGLQGPSAGGRPAPTGRFLLRRRRPTPGAQRLGGPISIGERAFGRRSACADREVSFASAEADAWRASALRGRFQSAREVNLPGRWVCADRWGAGGPDPGVRRPDSVPRPAEPPP
jgi:hypothetical protein